MLKKIKLQFYFFNLKLSVNLEFYKKKKNRGINVILSLLTFKIRNREYIY
jgi:hypothetical protein